MTALTTDVLVIGLGPAGGSAAAAAARFGLRVVAIDRKKEIGQPVQCAEFIPLPLARCARPDGVLVQRITGMTTWLPSGAEAATPFPGLMIDRAAFDAALAKVARAAGAVIHTATRLTALRPEASEAIIAAPGARLKVRYRLLIAADGPNSVVARLTGLRALPTVSTRQYTVPLIEPFEDTNIWLSPRYPGGYAWLFPKADVANLGLGVDPRFARSMKSPLDALHRQLAAEGRLGREILFRTGGAIPVGGLRERLVNGRVVFTGDAAGLTHPITGAGIAAAVVSGERAGEAAHALIAQNKTDALNDYEEDIRDQFADSLARAVRRRRELARIWNTPRARSDAAHRRGWIAFREYFSEEAACRDAA